MVSSEIRQHLSKIHQGKNNKQYKDGRMKYFSTHPEEKRLYQTWIGIRRRAGGNRFKYDTTDRHAHIYNRLSVYEGWNDWLNFREWAFNNGWKPGLTIDRINNNDGYNPDNCRWVSREENNRNRRCVKKYLYNGNLLTLPQIANLCNIPRDRLYNRVINYGYSVEDAINKPVKSGKNWIEKPKPEKISIIKKRRNENIVKDRKNGMMYKEMSKKYNLCERQLLDIVKKYV